MFSQLFKIYRIYFDDMIKRAIDADFHLISNPDHIFTLIAIFGGSFVFF